MLCAETSVRIVCRLRSSVLRLPGACGVTARAERETQTAGVLDIAKRKQVRCGLPAYPRILSDDRSESEPGFKSI